MSMNNVHDFALYTRSSLWRMLLGMVYVVALTEGGLLGMKIMLLGGVSLTGSALAFPLCGTLITIVAEVYGYPSARRMVYVGMLCIGFAALTFDLVAALPDGARWQGSAGVDAIEHFTARFIFTTGLAFFLSQITILELVYAQRTPAARYAPWQRFLLIPFLGQVCCAAVLVPGYYLGLLGPRVLLQLFVGRVAYSLVFVLVAYQLIRVLTTAIFAAELRAITSYAARAAAYVTTAQEQRALRLVELMSDGVVAMNAQSHMHYVNPAFCRITQYSRAELVGQELTMLMPEPLRARHRAGMERVNATGQRALDWDNMVLPVLRKDGTQIACRIAIQQYEQNGKPMYSGIVIPVQRDPMTEELMRERQADTT